MRALAISPDGSDAISGSFDTSAIRWSLKRNVAEQVMRFHDGAVNAVVWLKDGRLVTAGADAHIAIWTQGEPQPDKVLDGHTGPIVGARGVAGRQAARVGVVGSHACVCGRSTARAPRVFEGNAQNVNGVAFSPDGRALVSAGYDATLRIWKLAGGGEIVRNLPTPLNTVAVAPDGEIVTAGADGKVYFLSPQGEMLGDVQAAPTPIIELAISPDGALVAAAGIRGSVAVIDRKTRQLERTLVGPGLPVWSVAFFPDSRTLLTGGTDRMIRRWNAVSGEPIDTVVVGAPSDPLAAYAGDPGAQVFRACVACHTLTPDEGNKAGPSLHGIFGRSIATLPGYSYSRGAQAHDIVWTPETVAKMFEVGPMTYTPGTKMPEQTIGSAEDRKALVEFLERAAMKK